MCLGGLPLGDVEHHPLDQLRVALGVGQHDRRVAEPDDAPAPADQSVLEDERLARFAAAEVGVERFVVVIRMEHRRPQIGILDVLVRRVPQERLDLRAHVRGAHAFVGHIRVHDRRDLFHEGPELRLCLVQIALGLRELRHVQHQAEPVDRRALLVADEETVFADPQHASVAVVRAVFDAEGLARLSRPDADLHDTVVVVRVERLLPWACPGEPFLTGDPQRGLHGWAHVDHQGAGTYTVDVDDCGELLDQRAIPDLEVPKTLSGVGRDGIAGPRSQERSVSGHARCRLDRREVIHSQRGSVVRGTS